MIQSKVSRWLAILLIVVVIPLVLIFSYAHRPGDFAGYLIVGELGLAGRDIYSVALNTWPPFFGFLCIPLALMGRISGFGASAFWLLLSWAALIHVMYAIVGIVSDRSSVVPDGPPDHARRKIAIVLLPILFCSYWILNSFQWLQISIILFAMTMYGLQLHRDGHDAGAGLFIGAAAAIKVMPILFVPYFAWRRQWRAALFTFVFAIAWSVLPALVYGWRGFARQFSTWLHVLDAGWGAGKSNLSVYAMFDRILGHGYVPLLETGSNQIAASGSPIVTWAVLAALGLVTASAMWIFRGPCEPRSRATVAEWSVVFIVASIFGTVAWKHYLVVLLLPMALFVATWRDERVDPSVRRKLRAITWAAFGLSLITASDLAGDTLASRLEMGSLPTMGVLMLLGTLFWYRHRMQAQ